MLTTSPTSVSIFRIFSLGLLLFSTVMATNSVAMDKRTFVHIVKPGTNSLNFTFCETRVSSRQYLPNGQFKGKIENESLLTKAVLRFSIAKKLELAFGIPYLPKREQKRTNPAGVSTYKFDSEGWGDADVQLTWQWRDSRKGGLGFLTGVELKLPTGNKDRGLGSDTWDTIYRSALSYKTAWGFPYAMAIYTATGTTTNDNVRTDPGDDLYLAAGFKSLFWHKLGFNLSAYTYIDTSRTINENNGQPAVMEKYTTPGWKLQLRYRFSDSLEWLVFHERSYPEDHTMNINGTIISKKLDDKKRTGTVIKYFW